MIHCLEAGGTKSPNGGSCRRRVLARCERAARASLLGAGVVVSMLAGGREAGGQASTPNAIPSSTNGQGFDTHLFRPAMDSKGLFSINGSDIIGKNEISFGL